MAAISRSEPARTGNGEQGLWLRPQQWLHPPCGGRLASGLVVDSLGSRARGRQLSALPALRGGSLSANTTPALRVCTLKIPAAES